MFSLTYTPSLVTKEYYMVKKIRRLPIKGEIFVKVGEEVSHNTIVGKTSVPGSSYVINVSDKLGVELEDIKKYMLIKEGDVIKKDEPLANYNYFFGLFKETCYSPITGILEFCSTATGQAIIREMPIPITLTAYISGIIKKVIPDEGVVIETLASYIQGIFGIGGERHGEIKMIAKNPDDIIEVNQIGYECKGKILICGSIIDIEILKKAIEIGVNGIIVGGLEGKTLRDLLGEEIGVIITGQEERGITLIITEGFGKMSMRKEIFNLLKKNEGKLACINGATQIRAGVVRPEIIIPKKEYEVDKNLSKYKNNDVYTEGLKPGKRIRIIREPFFGNLGKVKELPLNLQKIESGSEVRVLIVELDDGRNIIVPRANVEII